MQLNEYNITFEKLEFSASSLNVIMRVTKNDTSFCMMGTMHIRNDVSNLYVNFARLQGKSSNDDIIVARAVDKALRPLLSSIKQGISVNLILLSNAVWADIKYWSIFLALYMVRNTFQIDMGVASVCIGGLYFERYTNQSGYALVCGNSAEMVFLETEGNAIPNMSDVVEGLLKQAQLVADLIKSYTNPIQPILYTYATKYKRTDRGALEHRKFALTTNVSNNALIISRGETSIMSVLSFSNKSEANEFEHTYKSDIHSKQSRRDIGHTFLVQKALGFVVKNNSIMRNISIQAMSYVLNANGSTSMASVMGVALNMLKEGFILPWQLLYGISFGVIKNQLVCDLTAEEDNASITDFKVIADGNANVYAIQMDTKAPLPVKFVYKILAGLKSKFAQIKDQIHALVQEKHIHRNAKTVLSADMAQYFKQHNLIATFSKLLTRCYTDNKQYIHLQNNAENNLLNEICNFYFVDQLSEGTNVCIVLTDSIYESTILNNWHKVRFTTKCNLNKGDVIRAKVKGKRLELIETILTVTVAQQ